MEKSFKYKNNVIVVSSTQSKEEARDMSARIFRALKSIAGLQGKDYSINLDIKQEAPAEEPAAPAAPVTESKKKK